MNKISILGMTLAEIQQSIAAYNWPKYTASEIARWVYQKRAQSIDDFTNISKKARVTLREHFEVGRKAPTQVSTSADGTRKYLFGAMDKRYIETAYIPDEKRNTLCVSSQVGCKLGCLFCMTAQQGFQGQLSAGQIINQVLSIDEADKVSNLVFMGMGEPFDNTDEVLKALEILTSDYGLGISPKRITVSTVGLLPGMKRFIEESACHLAVSLHSPFDQDRANLMPVENVYPIQKVIDTLRNYSFEKQRRISFEYIVFKGVNDSTKHINQLARLLNGLRCRINIMRFHSIPNSPLKGTSESELIAFRDGLNQKGIIATIRASRGEDILAACGLLSTKEINKS